MIAPVRSDLAPTQRGFGPRIDGHKVMWWGTKKAAIVGVQAIGWRASDLVVVHTRFQAGYAIAHLSGWLGREDYATLLADSEAQR